MRSLWAWGVSAAAGTGSYAAILLSFEYGDGVLPEGSAWAPLVGFARILLLAAFVAVAAFAPRPWGVPGGVLAGAVAFAAAVGWGGLWAAGDGYEGPGPGLGVYVVGIVGVLGASAGAFGRTMWAASRRPRPD